MKIDILNTDHNHPVNKWLDHWKRLNNKEHDIRILRQSSELNGGDYLFLISCHEIIKKMKRDLYRFVLVIHASPLPSGRGMSPHIWQILEGKSDITITLLNAEDALDSGDIWHQLTIRLDGGELYDEINRKIFNAEIELMSWALNNCKSTVPKPQTGQPSYYCRRTPEDSRLDPSKSIESQFNLIRVADPERYPTFFELYGNKYKIIVTRMEQ